MVFAERGLKLFSRIVQRFPLPKMALHRYGINGPAEESKDRCLLFREWRISLRRVQKQAQNTPGVLQP